MASDRQHMLPSLQRRADAGADGSRCYVWRTPRGRESNAGAGRFLPTSGRLPPLGPPANICFWPGAPSQRLYLLRKNQYGVNRY